MTRPLVHTRRSIRGILGLALVSLGLVGACLAAPVPAIAASSTTDEADSADSDDLVIAEAGETVHAAGLSFTVPDGMTVVGMDSSTNVGTSIQVFTNDSGDGFYTFISAIDVNSDDNDLDTDDIVFLDEAVNQSHDPESVAETFVDSSAEQDGTDADYEYVDCVDFTNGSTTFRVYIFLGNNRVSTESYIVDRTNNLVVHLNLNCLADMFNALPDEISSFFQSVQLDPSYQSSSSASSAGATATDSPTASATAYDTPGEPLTSADGTYTEDGTVYADGFTFSLPAGLTYDAESSVTDDLWSSSDGFGMFFIYQGDYEGSVTPDNIETELEPYCCAGLEEVASQFEGATITSSGLVTTANGQLVYVGSYVSESRSLSGIMVVAPTPNGHLLFMSAMSPTGIHDIDSWISDVLDSLTVTGESSDDAAEAGVAGSESPETPGTETATGPEAAASSSL